MQDVKTFIQGTALDGRVNVTPIETQLNEFLKANPAYSAKSMSFIVGPRYREAFVIFDVRDNKKPETNSAGNKNGQQKH